MLFPETPRVIYNKNPLDEVICQVRFPVVLRINSELPADFQEAIRQEYPLLQERDDVQINLPDVGPSNLPQDFISAFSIPSTKKHFDFLTKDEIWKATLTDNFLALTTTQYTRWEEFYGRFEALFNLLLELYKPAFFSRIGLRYRDVIRPSRLGLEDKKWSHLINPILIGVLGSEEDISQNVKGFVNQVEFELNDVEGVLRLVHGLVREDHKAGYLIDSDFFKAGQIPLADALGLLSNFNKNASRLIRWSVTDTLHQAMEPQKI